MRIVLEVAGRGVGVVVAIAVLLLALLPLVAAADILRSDGTVWRRAGRSKSAWLAIVLIGWTVGALVYFARVRRQLFVR